MEPLGMPTDTDFVREFLCGISNNPRLVESNAIRFPERMTDADVPCCMACLDVGCKERGLKWNNVGPDAPTAGTLVENEALSLTLQTQVEFTQDEFDKLGLPELAYDSYIKSGDCYFIPGAVSFAIYVRLQCQGASCLYDPERPNSRSAMTWLCEKCAVDIDINKQGAVELGRDKIKRNFVCQCDESSPCIASTYIVTSSPGIPQNVYMASDKGQVSLVLDGKKFFAGMPSMQELVEDPSCMRIHARACLLEQTVYPQPLMDPIKRQRINDAAFRAAAWLEDGDVGGRWEVSYAFKTLVLQDCFNMGCFKGYNCVSLQMIKVDNAVLLIAGTPKSTVKMVDNPGVRFGAKVSRTRGISKGRQGAGCDGSMVQESEKNGENTVSFKFDLGGQGDITILVDAMLPPGEMMPFLDSLKNEDNFKEVPSFIPMAKMDVITTNVLTSDVKKMQEIRAICKDRCKFDETGEKFALHDVCSGGERIFKSIADVLRITGFGTNAPWQWQVVMFRQGSVYLTLYILVAQKPYPGLWVIMQKTDTAVGSTSVRLMGKDMAPYGEYVDRDHRKTVSRGLWTKHGTEKFYFGFTQESHTLRKCLNRDKNRYGPVLTDLFEAGFLSEQDMDMAFDAQATKETARLADNMMDMGSRFIQKHTSDEEKRRAAERRRLDAHGRYDMGIYGTIFLNLRRNDSTAEPVFAKDHKDPGLSVYFTITASDEHQDLWIFAFRHEESKALSHIEPFEYKFIYVNDNGEEMTLEDNTWTSGEWSWKTSLGTSDVGKQNMYILKNKDDVALLKVYTVCK